LFAVDVTTYKATYILNLEVGAFVEPSERLNEAFDVYLLSAR
jgi:hypothetical protein